MGLLWFGVGLGILLLLAKMGSYMLLTTKSVKVFDSNGKCIDTVYAQREIKRWIFWGKKQGIRERINESTFLLFLVDVVGGWVGMHVLGAFGASILAMVAMTSYTIACMAILSLHFTGGLGKKLWTKLFPKGRRYAY